MSSKRYVDTAFWRDSYVVTLSPEQKHIFNYLLTNPATNLCGVYELAKKIIAFETGYEVTVIDAVFEKLVNDKKIAYVSGWVCLVNRPNHQYLSNTIGVAINRELNSIPKPIFEALPIQYLEGMDRVWIGYGRGIDKPKLKPKLKPSEEVTTNVVTKNPEVEEVVTAFKTQVGRMRRERYQAAAASKLLGEYGRERTLAAIVAVVGSKGRPYAPGITNLEDLWDKWPNLESFFRRESGKANKVLEV